jgi:general stress protein 26
MNWELFWLFVILNVVNVIIQTVKSIATIRCGKWAAALINAIAYGLYTVVVVYTVCDLNLWVKVAVVAIANLIGVYVVKLLEEKARKDKLWEVRATVKPSQVGALAEKLDSAKISYNCLKTSGDYRVFNIYCPTQKESLVVKELLTKYRAKYFVSESKTL